MRKLMRSISQNWPYPKCVFKSEPSKKMGQRPGFPLTNTLCQPTSTSVISVYIPNELCVQSI